MLWKKTKNIHIIRHGQSISNILPYDVSVKDPILTSTGRQQAEALGKVFRSPIDLIVCSPLRRAVYTALYAFGDILKASSKRIVTLPELQELSKYPCDTGSPLNDLEVEFRGFPVDLSLVQRSWDSKEGYWSPTERRSLQRVKEARRWLRDRPEQNIVVIGHGHCIQLLTEEGSFHDIRDGLVWPGWENTEYRSYHFDPKSEGDEARLTETKESLKRREARARIKPEGSAKMSGGSSKSSPTQMTALSMALLFRTRRTT
jgi:broad specificity phosphatase PhoE